VNSQIISFATAVLTDDTYLQYKERENMMIYE